MLANQLRVVQQALAQARADEMDATISSAELDRIGSSQDRISELEAASHKLTLERNTAVIEARRLQRDLSATQDALADAERRGAASGRGGGSTRVHWFRRCWLAPPDGADSGGHRNTSGQRLLAAVYGSSLAAVSCVPGGEVWAIKKFPRAAITQFPRCWPCG
jgi:hypothetical protein